MEKIEKLFAKLDPFFNLFSALILAGMVLVIVLQVVLRWFNISLAWTVEAAQYLFVWMTFVAGYAGARALNDSRRMVLTDSDVFPPGTISLNGLKIYGEESGKVTGFFNRRA